MLLCIADQIEQNLGLLTVVETIDISKSLRETMTAIVLLAINKIDNAFINKSLEGAVMFVLEQSKSRTAPLRILVQ